MKTDLHIHSRYSSDGEVTPGRILEMCLAAGIEVFTISDHNTVAGAQEMEQILEREPQPVSFIPAIEIDCVFEGTDMHLLGFGIDTRKPDFAALEREMNALYYQAFDVMVDRIREIGFPADRDKIVAFAGGMPPVGEMIIEVMLTEENRGCGLLAPYYPGGERSDMPYLNFYFDWFAQGCPAYVPVKFMDFSDAVQLMKSTGGIPVVAHPGLNFKGREDAAERLLEHGAEGLECFNNYHTPEQARYFADLAVKNGAVITRGSDYHGKMKPLIDIGVVANEKQSVEYSAYLDKSVEKLLRGAHVLG